MELFIMLVFLGAFGGAIYLYSMCRKALKEIDQIRIDLKEEDITPPYTSPREEIYEGRSLWSRLYGKK